MRLNGRDVFTDHTLLTDVGPDNHHPAVAVAQILVNATSIPPGAYNLSIPLGKTGCQTLRAILRGVANIDIQGHEGVFCVGGPSSAQSGSIGIVPYPGGVTSYMGGYSRLHGDAYLSHNSFGETYIRLNDCYISGSNAVFVFYNVGPVNKNLTVYGTVMCK